MTAVDDLLSEARAAISLVGPSESASLRRLGLRNVHDLVGGFAAWAAAGLPVAGATES